MGKTKYSQTVGDMRITVRLYSEAPDRFGEDRQTFSYRIAQGRHVWHGHDLYTGVGHRESAQGMFVHLLSFLSEYGEAYGYRMRPSEDYSEVPDWVQVACYLNSDELSMAELDSEL